MPERRAIAASLTALALLATWAPPAPAQEACTISGTGGDDVIPGTAGPDVICGQGGDDTIQALGGDDIVHGGPGEDAIEGGPGTDLLFGEEGADTIAGDGDGDYLDGGPDLATLDGGEGADACRNGTAVSCRPPNAGDPNDTPGRADVMQVRSFAHEDPPRWKIRTFANWTTNGIWDAGYFIVFVDTFSDPAPDYHVLAYSNGTKIQGGLYSETANGGETRIGPASVTKSGGRGVVIRLPLEELNRSRPYFRWNVVTLFTGKGCHKVCFDRVPGPALLPQAVLAQL